MSAVTAYPKRLIEVDLPIERISAHARREKSIRHGHISTLHIWWARRPLAACRAVILGALWPDPRQVPMIHRARRRSSRRRGRHMLRWARDCAKKAGSESFGRLTAIEKNPALLDDPLHLRTALLDFIADFADWDNSTDAGLLEDFPRARASRARGPWGRARTHGRSSWIHSPEVVQFRSKRFGWRRRIRQRPEPYSGLLNRDCSRRHPEIRATPRRGSPQMGRVG